MMQSPKDKLVESNCSCCCCWGGLNQTTREPKLCSTTQLPTNPHPRLRRITTRWPSNGGQTFAEWSTTGGENEDLWDASVTRTSNRQGHKRKPATTCIFVEFLFVSFTIRRFFRRFRWPLFFPRPSASLSDLPTWRNAPNLNLDSDWMNVHFYDVFSYLKQSKFKLLRLLLIPSRTVIFNQHWLRRYSNSLQPPEELC